ncbi:von Willebrand factor A domain-containing protein 7-like isoform X2 [Pseudonaja textilis]|uniref:von Willebrand factor A domain-containing protein 7-like isoform X1 n=1 Tax=Pseudonaja textilis TaxID=8673 RepID=UPI000EA9386B|nr:von Willebrand factor A domain-containing protein 7-like isoform X1 [Pseudonaja textilis]XP_026575822.1 von Willebrand factor A domain-containing protein 7-like isoform X2 [Pseudonaja textilis]
MLLSLLFYAGIVSGFRPNHESGEISSSDFTDTDITELGALRAVAWYMERNPLPGRPALTPGELENMNPLNATGLFKAYYKADVSPSRFIKAIQEIVTGNNLVESSKGNSDYYFYCEQFSKSINQIRILGDSMLSSLKGEVNTPALEAARQNAGRALHVVQKFYSNTNWVEMEKSSPYEYLLNQSSPVIPTAPVSKKTCDNCKRISRTLFQCENNLLVKDMLTSGYKVSISCKRKLPGKCGHGGKYDVTEMFPITGGINKETSNPELSPHYRLHQKAAELAIEATKSFFVGDGFGLLSNVGDITFKKFFNLDGYSLAFVVDTTGSMSDDISQVKTKCIELLRTYSGSPDAPFNYILVPFNDPEVGPIIKTQSVDELESAISRLTATGGGDCPEMSMTGLKLALQQSMPRSKIFVFTDAGAKDESLKGEVEILIDSSKSIVNYLLTGYCDSRKRRSAPEVKPKIFANSYEELADYSGGFYVLTSKSQLSQVLGIMEKSLNAAPVKLIDGQMYTSNVSIPVDETIKELTISVKASTSFSMKVFQPSGTQLGSLKMLINLVNQKVVKISPIPEPGSWTVKFDPISTYTILVEGKSLMDFDYQILQKEDEYVLPVQGRPVKGLNYTVSMKLMGDNSGMQVLRLVPLSEDGTPLESIPLSQSFDALGNIFAVGPISLHGPRTLLKVEGLSPGNFPFVRISGDSITTEFVQVLPLPEQNSTMAPGGTLEISVLVVNYGAGKKFGFKVWDDRGFMSSYEPKERFLNTGENVTLTATFIAPIANDSFASSIVTFTANSGSAQNYLKIPISVIPEIALKTDEVPPVYKLREFFVPCRGHIQSEPDCRRYTWQMSFTAMDDKSAVTVKINANPSGLTCTPIRGDVKNVICEYRSTCCDPLAEVLISDDDGNTSSFTMDYRNPKPSPS